MARRIKVSETTREERIRIVAEALSFGDNCGDCSLDSCGIDRFYAPYIEGECELSELNARRASTGYVTGGRADEGGPSCLMQ